MLKEEQRKRVPRPFYCLPTEINLWEVDSEVENKLEDAIKYGKLKYLKKGKKMMLIDQNLFPLGVVINLLTSDLSNLVGKGSTLY